MLALAILCGMTSMSSVVFILLVIKLDRQNQIYLKRLESMGINTKN